MRFTINMRVNGRDELFIIETADNVRAVGKVEDIRSTLFYMTGNAGAEATVSHWMRNISTLCKNGADEFKDWFLISRFPWPGR